VDKKHEPKQPAEYQVGNTRYTVTSVFGEAAQKEPIENKIRRLILQDSKQKGAKL
jgi:hypothetical protein